MMRVAPRPPLSHVLKMPPHASPTTLEIIATSSLVSTVVAALINVGSAWWRDRQTRRVGARLSALSVIGVIETWINCAYETAIELGSMERFQRYADQEMSVEEWIGEVPELPAWPTNIDWHALGVDGSLAIINFENGVRMSRSAARLEHTHYIPDAQAKVGLYTARLIRDATTLVEEMRRTWRLKAWRGLAYANIAGRVDELVAQYEAERSAIEQRTTPSEK